MLIQDKIRKAKALLLVEEQPFFGTLLLSLKLIENNDIQLARTNGLVIEYNANRLVQLDVEYVKFILLHEVMHVALLHCFRMKDRVQFKWNIAADYAVNLMIREEIVLKGCLRDAEFKGMSAEEIYDKLTNIKIEYVMMEDLLEIPANKRNEALSKIVQAYEACKKYGNLPSGVQQAIDELKNSQVGWQSILQNIVHNLLAKDDQRWSPPNRRYIQYDMFLPSNYSEKIDQVVVAIDTSGSIDKTLLTQFASEIKTIKQFVDNIRVLTCDAAIHEDIEIRDFEDFIKKIQFKGSGGTDFRPVFNKIEEEKANPSLLIYLTDGQGDYPEKEYPYPILWVIFGNTDIDIIKQKIKGQSFIINIK